MRAHELKSITGDGRRWTADTAAKVLGALSASQSSMAAFARLHGVNVQRLSWWRKRLEGGQARPAVTFIPAVEPYASQRARLLLRLPGGVEVEAAEVSILPADWVGALARALASRP